MGWPLLTILYQMNDFKRCSLFSAFQFISNVLLPEIAQAKGGNDIEEAVITVPFHFSDDQRTAMRYRYSISCSILL